MSGHAKWSTLRDQLRSDPERRRRLELMDKAADDAVRLGKLREARHVTQVQLAAQLGTSQANVSHLERRDDLYLSTLSGYVEALGGRLELRAVFPDDVIAIDIGLAKEPAAAR